MIVPELRTPRRRRPCEKPPARARTLRQSLTTQEHQVSYLLGSRAHVMRSRQLRGRWHVFSYMNMFVDDASLKKLFPVFFLLWFIGSSDIPRKIQKIRPRPSMKIT
jgi:hypothetical protein